ncbi:MAG TPA: hypothetical protein VH684_21120 [Xanthobacteraceae bacterium]|jgi:hypothetical protein
MHEKVARSGDKAVHHPDISQQQFVVAPHVAGKIKPNNNLGPLVGAQQLAFSYVDTGGPGNLLPGFVNTRTAALTWPAGAGSALIVMQGFGVAFVDENDNINDHHLGDLMVNFYFKDNSTAACDFMLRDSSVDEGVNMWARGLVVYFGG